MNALIRLITADLHTLRILGRSCCGLDILRKVDQNRSRLSSTCNVKCHLNNFSKVFPILHRHTILGNASCHSDNVNLLERIISDKA